MKRLAIATLVIALLAACGARLALMPAAHAQASGDQKKIVSVIRPAPTGAGGGPWFVTSEANGTVFKVTTGLGTAANPTAAIDQAQTDGASQLTGGYAAVRIVISTDARVP